MYVIMSSGTCCSPCKLILKFIRRIQPYAFTSEGDAAMHLAIRAGRVDILEVLHHAITQLLPVVESSSVTNAPGVASSIQTTELKTGGSTTTANAYVKHVRFGSSLALEWPTERGIPATLLASRVEQWCVLSDVG